MTSTYQRFLDFFQLTGTQRLDGLDASYFEAMTADERRQAYDLLWSKVEKGGTDESVNGLFLVDETRAVVEVTPLLDAGRLRPQAEVLAAWNIHRLTKDVAMVAHFARRLLDQSAKVRGSAAYYAPEAAPTHSLIKGLQGMVLTETEGLPLIHALNKLLQCHGITETSVDKKSYLDIYRGLRSDDAQTKIATFDLLNQRYPIAFVDE